MHTRWQSRVKSHESYQVKSPSAACLISVGWTPVISVTAAILCWAMNVERIIFLRATRQSTMPLILNIGTEAK